MPLQCISLHWAQWGGYQVVMPSRYKNTTSGPVIQETTDELAVCTKRGGGLSPLPRLCAISLTSIVDSSWPVKPSELVDASNDLLRPFKECAWMVIWEVSFCRFPATLEVKIFKTP